MKKSVALVIACAALAASQSGKRPTFDPRLSVHTLVREDIFAGFLGDDMERFSRGEKTLDRLLVERPEAKPEILTWQGGAALKRSIIAHEQNHPDEFQQHYRQALDLFAEAARLGPEIAGVAAVTGGSYVLFADRLPDQYRAAAWSKAYEAYRLLWKQQEVVIDRLPLHIKGELLTGLAQTAQRTGRSTELAQDLERVLAELPNTPYEAGARKWKENPEIAAHTSITCKSCHEPGRLAAQTAALTK